jgi:hypothetical protein
MDPRTSLHIYPRFDSDYRKKKSLNFDNMKAEIFFNRKETKYVRCAQWFAYFLIGVITGVFAFLMSLLEEWLLDKRMSIADQILLKSD